MKILSVDDSAIIRKIIRGAVEVLHYELLEAADGQEGLEILQKEYGDVELILLDWNMPGMNGLEFLQRIKADAKFGRIPVMMVTTESEKENIIKAIQAGAVHYMTKPFTIEEMTKKILQCLGRDG
ncbi:MAG: response regulator [Clostridia bacterium]|nr:response regulator [Clostridia bacterium]